MISAFAIISCEKSHKENIKSNDPNSFITIVCSNKNYDYISKYKNIDQIIIYKKNILSYFFNFLKLFKKNLIIR